MTLVGILVFVSLQYLLATKNIYRKITLTDFARNSTFNDLRSVVIWACDHELKNVVWTSMRLMLGGGGGVTFRCCREQKSL